MKDIEERIYPQEDISKLEALDLEQATTNLFIVCVVASILSFCNIELSVVWAGLGLFALRRLKSFLRKVNRGYLYAYLLWSFILWFALGLLTFVYYILAFWVLADSPGRIMIWVKIAGVICRLLSQGFFLLVLILLYRCFDILFGVFYKKVEISMARIYLIGYCILRLLAINLSGIVFLLGIESSIGVRIVPFKDIFEHVFGFYGLLSILFTVAGFILLYLVSFALLILFFLTLRRVYPYLRAVNAGLDTSDGP